MIQLTQCLDGSNHRTGSLDVLKLQWLLIFISHELTFSKCMEVPLMTGFSVKQHTGRLLMPLALSNEDFDHTQAGGTCMFETPVAQRQECSFA